MNDEAFQTLHFTCECMMYIRLYAHCSCCPSMRPHWAMQHAFAIKDKAPDGLPEWQDSQPACTGRSRTAGSTGPVNASSMSARAAPTTTISALNVLCKAITPYDMGVPAHARVHARVSRMACAYILSDADGAGSRRQKASTCSSRRQTAESHDCT